MGGELIIQKVLKNKMSDVARHKYNKSNQGVPYLKYGNDNLLAVL